MPSLYIIFWGMLLPFFLEMADQRQRDFKLKDFPSPEHIEELALVKLRLAFWWFIMTIFFCFGAFPFIIIENTTKRNGAHDFHVEDNKTKNRKTNPRRSNLGRKSLIRLQMRRVLLYWNRFPDNLKSDNVGTLANSKQASKDKAKSTQTRTSLFWKKSFASTITEANRPYAPVFFSSLL